MPGVKVINSVEYSDNLQVEADEKVEASQFVAENLRLMLSEKLFDAGYNTDFLFIFQPDDNFVSFILDENAKLATDYDKPHLTRLANYLNDIKSKEPEIFESLKQDYNELKFDEKLQKLDDEIDRQLEITVKKLETLVNAKRQLAQKLQKQNDEVEKFELTLENIGLKLKYGLQKLASGIKETFVNSVNYAAHKLQNAFRKLVHNYIEVNAEVTVAAENSKKDENSQKFEKSQKVENEVKKDDSSDFNFHNR